MTRNSDRAQIDYLRWLSREHPELYRRVADDITRAGKLGSLRWIAAVVNAVAQVGSAVLQKKQQDKQLKLATKAQAASDAQAAAEREAALKFQLLEINTKRAQAGLPPVDINGRVIPGAALPTPQGLTALTSQKVAGIPVILLAAGAGLILVFALKR